MSKCVDICSSFTCGPNSICKAVNHRGQCQCLSGFTGNPNDRRGCRPVPRDECQTDAQCPEADICSLRGSVRKCIPACNVKQCGPGSVCVANNHVAQCQCPPGLFAGNPDDLGQGCSSVGCLINDDCPTDKACNRLNFQCFDVCYDACGDNAVCIAENHRYSCQCAPGFKPNPSAEIECSRSGVCDNNPCHKTAECVPNGGTHLCTCPNGMIGDPYTTGCHQEGTCPAGDSDCSSDSVCVRGYCKSPCDRACGPNALCNVVNRRAQCNCPPGFQPNPTPDKGCSRITNRCSNNAECIGGTCIQGQCMEVCRVDTECAQGEKCVDNKCITRCISSQQCPFDQSCINGICLIGCRSNSDCPSNQACISNKCKDPCSDPTICGPNSICQTKGSLAQCVCPENFQKIQLGCIRIPTACDNNNDCKSGEICDMGQCKPGCSKHTQCAQGEHCTRGMCMKVCFNDGNCLQGEVCIEGSCESGCRHSGDCNQNEMCISKKCLCAKGYNPSGTGCVDVDECQDNPCHSSAICTNVPGSYKCACPTNTIGDPYGNDGCIVPNECIDDNDCIGQQTCVKTNGVNKCVDPCASVVCGLNAQCQSENRKPVCVCKRGHFGDPNDLSIGCVKADCIEDEDCSSNRACDKSSFRCISKCQSHRFLYYCFMFSIQILFLALFNMFSFINNVYFFRSL